MPQCERTGCRKATHQLGVRSGERFLCGHSLAHCGVGGREDTWIPISFSPDVASLYRLGEGERWQILDARLTADDSWFVAIQTEQNGVLARVAEGERARLMATDIVGVRERPGREQTASGLVVPRRVTVRLRSEAARRNTGVPY